MEQDPIDIQPENEPPSLFDEAALRGSEEKYRTVLDSIDDGFCIIEVLFDQDEQPHDYLFLEANPAFLHQTGLIGAVGKRMRELAPEHETFWFEIYGQIARTGKPVRFEHQAKALPGDRWYEVFALRIGAPSEPHVAILFRDIAERKQREANQQLLVDISTDLGRLSNEAEIIRSVGAKLVAHLQLTCYHYVDVNEERANVTISHFWHALDVPDILGTYPIASFMPPNGLDILRSGESAIINDVQNDFTDDSAATMALKAGAAAHKIRSYVVVPYSQDSQWKAYFAVADTLPRQWTSLEVELIQDVGSRMFPRIERARAERALRVSEEKYRSLFETMSQGYAECELIRDPEGRAIDYRIITANAQFERLTGVPVDLALRNTARELVPGLPQSWIDTYARIVRTREPESFERPGGGQGRWFAIHAYPRGGDVVVLFDDITVRKEAEERQVFLLALSDALRPLSDAVEIQQAAMRVVGEFLKVDRTLYNEIRDNGETIHIEDNYVRGDLPKVTGDFPVRTFGSAMEVLRRGEILVIEDQTTTPLKTPLEREASTALGVFASATIPLIKAGRWVANFGVLHGSPRKWTENEIAMLQETAERTWAALERARAEEALREHQKNLQLLNETLEQKVQEKTVEVRQLATEVIRSTQRERQRLSQILHDDLQQRVYAIQMQMSFLRDGLQGEQVKQEMSGLENQLREILQITRHLSIDLSPPILKEEGLTHAIAWLGTRMQEQYNLAVEVKADGVFAISDEELHVLLFSSVRELLFNVVKHAGANQAVVTLKWVDAGLQIEVSDNGKGFLLPVREGETKDGGSSRSLGLARIQRQLSLFGGSIEIQSAPGAGTRALLLVSAADGKQE